MIQTELIEDIGALAQSQKIDAATEKLGLVHVQKLTKDELRAFGECAAALPEEKIASAADPCCNMILYCMQIGDPASAAKWHAHLTGLRDVIRESNPARPLLENRIFCAGLNMPQGPGSNLLLSLAVLANEYGGAKFRLTRLSATCGIPSVLRGAKDLSALGKHYRASASIVRPLLPVLLEDGASGVCEAAIAEILYEQNDLNGAALQAAAAINAENPEIVFAGLSILARLGAIDNNATPPDKVLAHIGEMIEKKNAPWLAPNYRARCARSAMLRGNLGAVREWMEQTGLNDLNGCTLRESYELMTKAKAYIALGEYRNAATLLESLALFMEKQLRPLDLTECLVNGAVACELLGSHDLANQKLERALLTAQEYGYVRVFADCGKQLFHLIVRYAKQERLPEELSSAYIKKIIEAAKTFSALCPALYEPNPMARGEGEGDDAAIEELTQSELHVLQLLDRGSSNKDIAQELGVSGSTVKFHLSNIFAKLRAANRVEAIKNARSLGLLQ